MAQVVMALVVTAQAGKAQGADGICVVFTYRSPDFHRALFFSNTSLFCNEVLQQLVTFFSGVPAPKTD